MDLNRTSPCAMKRNVISGRCGNYPKLWFFKRLVFTTLLTSHINHQAFKLYLFVYLFVNGFDKNKTLFLVVFVSSVIQYIIIFFKNIHQKPKRPLGAKIFFLSFFFFYFVNDDTQKINDFMDYTAVVLSPYTRPWLGLAVLEFTIV